MLPVILIACISVDQISSTWGDIALSSNLGWIGDRLLDMPLLSRSLLVTEANFEMLSIPQAQDIDVLIAMIKPYSGPNI